MRKRVLPLTWLTKLGRAYNPLSRGVTRYSEDGREAIRKWREAKARGRRSRGFRILLRSSVPSSSHCWWNLSTLRRLPRLPGMKHPSYKMDRIIFLYFSFLYWIFSGIYYPTRPKFLKFTLCEMFGLVNPNPRLKFSVSKNSRRKRF